MDPPSGSQPTAPETPVTAAKFFWEINRITKPPSYGLAGNTRSRIWKYPQGIYGLEARNGKMGGHPAGTPQN